MQKAQKNGIKIACKGAEEEPWNLKSLSKHTNP